MPPTDDNAAERRQRGSLALPALATVFAVLSLGLLLHVASAMHEFTLGARMAALVGNLR
jgi:hypothetical protein